MFCNESEGGEGGSYEAEEDEWIWTFPTSSLRQHTEIGGKRAISGRSFVPNSRLGLASMDIRYNHGSLVHCLRASHTQDAPDLLAIGGEHSVAILQVVSRFCYQKKPCEVRPVLDQLDTTATQIATFNVGCRITAIAWSSRTVSPSLSDDWSLE